MSDLASGYCAVSVISGSLRLSDHRGRPPFHCADVVASLCISLCIEQLNIWSLVSTWHTPSSFVYFERRHFHFRTILKLFLLLFICTYCWLLSLLIHLKRCF